MVCLLVTYRVRDGNVDEALRLLAELGEASRAEAGCVQYQAHQAVDDPQVLVLYECWADEAALDAHRGAEHFRRLATEGLFPLLDSREPVALRPFG